VLLRPNKASFFRKKIHSIDDWVSMLPTPPPSGHALPQSDASLKRRGYGERKKKKTKSKNEKTLVIK